LEDREVRINNRIRAREVRLIGVEGEQLGIVPFFEALRKAEDYGLDLVEVGSNANPPVCRIMDYGKYKYQRKKKQQEARKNQVVSQLKEVKIRYKTDEHDLQTKIRQARGFLMDGHKVKFLMYFRGREVAFVNLGHQTMERVAAEMMDVATLDKPPKMEGRQLAMYLASKGVVKRRPEGTDAEDED